jgi:hypothetical protein
VVAASCSSSKQCNWVAAKGPGRDPGQAGHQPSRTGAAQQRRLIDTYGRIRQAWRPLGPDANTRGDVPPVLLCLTCLAQKWPRPRRPDEQKRSPVRVSSRAAPVGAWLARGPSSGPEAAN